MRINRESRSPLEPRDPESLLKHLRVRRAEILGAWREHDRDLELRDSPLELHDPRHTAHARQSRKYLDELSENEDRIAALKARLEHSSPPSVGT